MSGRITVLLLLALMLASPAAASEQHPTLSELEHEVMCPTCKTLLELSHAPIAERMRAFIRQRIADGETKSEIKDQLVAEFGESVLAAPPMQGFGVLAWLLPFIGLFGAGAIVAAIAWRWRTLHASEAGPTERSSNGRVKLDPALERKLDRELAHYDG